MLLFHPTLLEKYIQCCWKMLGDELLLLMVN